MTRLFLACALWLVALVSPAAAQGGGFGFDEPEVRFELYHRVEGDQVQVAIRTTLKRKWHLYHEELGGPGAVAVPTKIEIEADGADFFAPVYPEPHRAEQPGLGPGGSDTWVWQHEGRFVIYALGELDDPEAAEDLELRVHIAGQVCEDGGVCIPVDETLSSKGAGPDTVFAEFPDAEVFTAKESTSEATAQDATANATALFEEAPKQVDTDKLGVELFVREEGDQVEAVVVFDMQEHWHIGGDRLRDDDEEAYALPTKLQLVGDGVTWNAPVFPNPYKFEDQYGSPWFFAHQGRALVYAKGKKTGSLADVAAWYAGQICEDGGVCIAFGGVVEPSGAGSDEDFAAARKLVSAGPASGGESRGGDKGGLLQFILLAIGGGLFALVMPCTYPMIPITISFFTKQADARGGSVLPLSIAYGLGIITIFVLIGVLLGAPIMAFATHPATNLIIGIAFLFFSLALFGAVNLQPPRFLMSAAGKASMQGGYIGVFLMGATLVITSFTCTAPFVGTLLAAGASSGGGTGPDYLRVAIGMGVFGLTMAIPFFFLSLVPGRVSAMPKGGEWMNTIKMTLGFVEVAAALKFFSNADLVLGWGVLSRELFLLMWAAIFALSSAYLFGLIKVKGHKVEELAPARAIFAMGFALFALYCWHGSRGYRMDNIMTALAPAYSSRLGGGGGAFGDGAADDHGASWTIVVDDYEGAKQRAIAEGKLLFLNFTGFT
ncbi:MAG: hypothetical protein H6831_11830 [Planctomycetes bacterium]|nr:hypothetical protein [Planctomycetota bacterium]MCB9905090.1 hypothetical protein [Planctomycetota bacterium]